VPQPFDADLSVFFSDFCDDITYAGVTVKGMVDRHDERAAGYGVEMVGRLVIVSVPYNAFPTPLLQEAAVIVDGTSMLVNTILQKNDGGVTTFSAVLP
jgi:hypothetical protein